MIVQAARDPRPPLAVALDAGSLDDVPSAIACVRAERVLAANREWEALMAPLTADTPDGAWLSAFDLRDRRRVIRSLGSMGRDVDVRLVGLAPPRGRVRVRTAPVTGHGGHSAVTISTIGLGAASEARLVHLATHDELTGLANRTRFVDALERRLAEPCGRVTLLFIDLDGFKMVNDRLGHVFGDALLRATAERIRAVVRDDDLVGRFGGDELVVLCSAVGEEGAIRLAERIGEAIELPFALGDRRASIGASIGVADAARDERSALTLLDAADAAMYAAKAAGGRRWARRTGDGTEAVGRRSTDHGRHGRPREGR